MTRCALANLAVVLALGLALSTAVTAAVRDQATSEVRRSGETAAAFVRYTLPDAAFRRGLSQREQRRLDVVVTGAHDLHGLRLWGPRGRLLYDSHNRGEGSLQTVDPLLQAAYEGRVGARLERGDGTGMAMERGPLLLDVLVPMRAAGSSTVTGAVQVHLPYEGTQASSDAVTRRIVAGLAVGLGALWGVLWWLSLRVTRTLRRRAAEQQVLARTDELTGLGNRRALLTALDRVTAERMPAALALLDLDRFKEVNDTLGHHVGDELLRQVGHRLSRAVRSTATVVRLGGDEFAVLLPGVEAPAEAMAVAQRVLDALEAPFVLQDLQLAVGASVGVALAPVDATTGSELLQRADVAMYSAKERGGGLARYDPAVDVSSPDRLALLSELRTGLADGELWLAYQPIWDLQTHGACTGVEALLRWDSPRRGPVPPSQFVALCERSSLVRELTRFVLDEALRQLRAWQDEGTVLNLAVNLSASNLTEDDLPELIAGLLGRHGIPASRVVVELTESAVIPDPERAAVVLGRLVDLGLDVALDDFGTGWSSMSRLLELPLAALKVDRSFVADLPFGSGAAVVRATTGLGHELGLFVVAEGIETVEQLEQVHAIGCDVAQGYLLSPPLRPEDVPAAASRDIGTWLAAARVPAQGG
jgi:diguanylate cyclase (GGDEF)-like protein